MSDSEALVIVGLDDTMELEGSENKLNGMVNRAEKQDMAVFYILPEGSNLHPLVDEAIVSSILRYSEDDPYNETRLDGHLTGREIDDVIYVGRGELLEEMKSADEERGRSATVDQKV